MLMALRFEPEKEQSLCTNYYSVDRYSNTVIYTFLP